jgi:hypothetical protein
MDLSNLKPEEHQRPQSRVVLKKKNTLSQLPLPTSSGIFLFFYGSYVNLVLGHEAI